uniref:FACT complex subunit SSRP1 n=1 Tax=Percolomonas cosmopolitus TaxID=63605 RepID=A0A7S1PGR7_9EUKA|mmetsp:Transcript_1044/g.3576  ORF Transcript_1044/g.3576 Transcript_1044/m.3576 type:complete len:432 (+) Transcript_1044:256-1551(+)
MVYASKYDENLVEIRFSVPTKDGDYSRIRGMHKHIMKQADVIAEAGEAIATFNEAPFIAPRGKYTVELFHKFMRLRGKSYDFKILYRDINMMFLLDDPDGRHVYFVIYLGTPVRQGQKQHFHLVMHYDRNAAVDAMKPFKVNLSKEEIAKKYPKQGLKTEMTGKLFQVVAKLFRGITGKKLIGAGDFSSFDGNKAVKSSMKVNEGNLFFLQKSIFFLHKPATYIRHDEIAQVSVQRAENKAFHGTRFFDLMVNLKNGKSHTFSNIDKKEEDAIVKYFKTKSIRVEGEVERVQTAAGILGAAFGDEDEEEEDEDFEAEDIDESADEADFEEFVSAPVNKDDASKDNTESDDKKRKREDDTSEAEGAPKKKKAKKDAEKSDGEKKTKKTKKTEKKTKKSSEKSDKQSSSTKKKSEGDKAATPKKDEPAAPKAE